MDAKNSSQDSSGLSGTQWQVLICGAGPVGLLCARLLGQAGVSTLVVERLEEPVDWSRAIGVSPPSLEILADAGLADSLVSGGVPIRDVVVHGTKGADSVLGKVSFSAIPSNWPFMLSVPQILTESVLVQGIERFACVRVLRGYEVVDFSQTETEARVTLRPTSDTDSSFQVSTSWVLGCDGMKSTLRSLAKIPFTGRRYKDTFVMGDFNDRPQYGDREGFGNKAHLFFTPRGAVESFPLPNGKRRWVVQTDNYIEKPGDETIVQAVFHRSGLELQASDLVWQSPFGVQRFIATQFRKDRLFLLGDAAHVMSPIGGQGMNTGFADAAQLVPLLIESIKGLHSDRPFIVWEKQRKRAFNVAASRAWRSMRLGTVRGKPGNLIRNFVLWIMLNGPGKSRVPLDYAMLTIPYHSKKKKES